MTFSSIEINRASPFIPRSVKKVQLPLGPTRRRCYRHPLRRRIILLRCVAHPFNFQHMESLLSTCQNNTLDTGNRRFDQGSPHPIGEFKLSQNPRTCNLTMTHTHHISAFHAAWYQERGAGVSNTTSATAVAGRSFYTSLGHLNETWEVSLSGRSPRYLIISFSA